MEIIKILHAELSIIIQFLSLDIIFFLLKISGITLAFILIRPAIQKLLGTGNRLHNFFDLLLKWGFTYILFVFFFQRVIQSYKYAPVLSVCFSILFLSVIIIPITLYLLSFIRFMSLIINRYFSIGDLIKVDNFVGRVRKIGFFNAQLYQEDGNTIIIPLKVFLDFPVKVIHSRNFSLFERDYEIKDIENIDSFLKTIQFKLKNLPYDMDLENMKVKVVDDNINVKIKYGPAYLSGVFSESVDKLMSNTMKEN